MEPNHARSERVSADTALASVLSLRESDPRSRALVLSSVYRQGPGLLAAATSRLRRPSRPVADLPRKLRCGGEVEASLQARRVDRSPAIAS
jgi:hypothetical protein